MIKIDLNVGDLVVLKTNDGQGWIDLHKIHVLTEKHPQGMDGDWFHIDNNNSWWFWEGWIIPVKKIIGE